ANGLAWDENADNSSVTDVEWSRISDEYTNGLTAGYATVGVPLGHQLGLLRGVSSVLLSFLKDSSDPSPSPSPQSQRQALLVEAQDIASQLARVRFSDIVPRDLEAEQHAREHLEKEDGADENEETARRREMEGIEDMLANLGASGRPRIHQGGRLDRLAVLAERLGLSLGIDLKAIALPHG
ncbi:hypothetical protein CPB84DRAFT_1798140, partial [Gymnopilus junonius]